MYESYWGLREKPFQNTPDPRFLYHSTQHEESLTRLIYTVRERMGAAMLTGVFGCGKTVLGQALLDEISTDRYKVAFITNPQVEYVELLRAIVRNLKDIKLPVKKDELSADYLLETLNDILINNMRDGRDTVVIIDEAHVIRDEKIFEGLRLLLNFQLRDRFLLTLLLFGQPELLPMIESNKQLEQRIAMKCHLGSLNEKETKEYVLHRLNVAGAQRPIFNDDAFKLIFEHSGGIPRRINKICDLGLLSGYGKGALNIDRHIIEEELASFGS
jgi:type II secretory pathway predicted ATPase ExeA